MMDYEIKDGVAIIPEGTEKINQAFLDCSNLKAIKVPANKVDYYKELLQSHTYRPGNIPELVIGI